VRFVLLPGHLYDTVGVAPLIDGLSFGALIVDTSSSSLSINAEPENCRSTPKSTSGVT
jgi:hypothetical protein